MNFAIDDDMHAPTPRKPVYVVVAMAGKRIAAHAILQPDITKDRSGRQTVSRDTVKMHYFCSAPAWRRWEAVMKRALQPSTYDEGYSFMVLLDDSKRTEGTFYEHMGFSPTETYSLRTGAY